MSPAFKVGSCLLLTIIWIAAGAEQVRLGQVGWDVAGCALLAITFASIALSNLREL